MNIKNKYYYLESQKHQSIILYSSNLTINGTADMYQSPGN